MWAGKMDFLMQKSSLFVVYGDRVTYVLVVCIFVANLLPSIRGQRCVCVKLLFALRLATGHASKFSFIEQVQYRCPHRESPLTLQ